MTDCPRTGKVTYLTRYEALQAREKIAVRIKRSRSKRRSFETSPHRCEYCGFWHLTSQ